MIKHIAFICAALFDLLLGYALFQWSTIAGVMFVLLYIVGTCVVILFRGRIRRLI